MCERVLEQFVFTMSNSRNSSFSISSNTGSFHTPRTPVLVLDAKSPHPTPMIFPKSQRKKTQKNGSSLTTTSTPSEQEETAAHFARTAPQAGFLQKLGANVSQFKRRFFVLQPGTHLYYFLSPTDTEPRGCLDLEQSTIQILGQLPDGRFRFAIVWGDQQQQQKVILEAKDKETATQWIEALQQERLSYVKDQLKSSNKEKASLTMRIQEQEKRIDNYRHMEQDRDEAVQDALHWKKQFHLLDDALRKLTLQVNSNKDNLDPRKTTKSDKENNNNDDNPKNESKITLDSPSATSLLDSIALDDDHLSDTHSTIDIVKVPGVHFSSLQNACDQLKESARLAYQEASTAVEDLQKSHEIAEQGNKRMIKAEKHLCKLWEENCELRKLLKQKKREKRVLAREVRALMEAAKKHEEERIALPEDDASASVIGSEDEKLLNELEESVMSSINLHQRYLSMNGAVVGGKSSQITKNEPPKVISASNSDPLPLAPSTRKQELVSLFDDSGDEESDDEKKHNNISPDQRHLRTISKFTKTAEVTTPPTSRNQTDISSDASERTNPLYDLDKDESLEISSVQSSSIKQSSAICTSRLECQLADVVDTNTVGALSSETEGNSTYHLTFYSKKIGIQFQKVPPPPSRPRGLLTDAIKSDLNDVDAGSDKNAAELQRIAAISSWAKDDSRKKETTCQVASPVDAVLVCGFHGFDDSGSNIRPRLGARLVAFDGVSVEVGRWTFESIRKSIQARSRPLTLSFRNDFLTAEQRVILTKAVQDVGAIPRPPSKAIRDSLGLSASNISNDSEIFVNNMYEPATPSGLDDGSVSTGSESRYVTMPRSFSGTRSVASRGSGKYRSFSEAGSSTSSMLSSVAPLVSSLLKGKREPFTPEYLRRAPASVEDTPEHQDFQSELL